MSESGRSYTLIVQKSAWGCTASLYLSAPPWMKKNPTKLKDAKAMLTVRADKTNITLEWIYWQDSSQTESFWEVDHSLVFHLAVHTTPKHFSISANLHLDESHVGLNGFALKTLCRIRDKMLKAYNRLHQKWQPWSCHKCWRTWSRYSFSRPSSGCPRARTLQLEFFMSVRTDTDRRLFPSRSFFWSSLTKLCLQF